MIIKCIFYYCEGWAMKNDSPVDPNKNPDQPIVELSSNKPADITIYATDEINKTDGVIIVGEVINNQYTPKEQVVFEQIDLEKKKQEKQKKINTNQKKKNKIVSAEAKKANTITSLIVLLVVGLLVAGYYFWTNRETEADFKLKNVTLELGKKASTKVSDYVTWKDIDELTYRLDVSKVDSNVVGEYKYTVTHANVTKYGKVKVSDTVAPQATTKELVIGLNETYIANDFIDECNDLSGCQAKFSDGAEEKTATVEGKDTAYIYVYDKYDNSRLLKIEFTVGAATNKLICERTIVESSRTTTDRVALTFNSDNIFTEGSTATTYTYKDKTIYDQFKLQNQGNTVFSFTDNTLTAIEEYTYTGKFYNLTDKLQIQNRLTNSNYLCE